MAFTTSIAPSDIATALGRPSPDAGSVTESQWQMWIDDALMLIQARADEVEVVTIDQARLNYVIREAVMAYVLRPDNATQVTVSVDDASTSKTYRSGTGRVTILDDWWRFLGLTISGSGAFSIRPYCTSGHSPYCDVMFDSTATCSCGAAIGMWPTRYDTWDSY
ncbi:MAG: hypothetical protein ABR616_13685 [Dermatophilaceae bacterium]